MQPKTITRSLHPPHPMSTIAPQKNARKARILMPVGFAPNTAFDLDSWLLSSRLGPLAEAYVRGALAGPSRHLSGSVSHTIHYPCAKLGLTIKFESRNYEYAFGLQCIYREDVVYAFEQPPEQKINRPNGGCHKYTPDLLVITPTGVEIYEVKPAETFAHQILKGHRLFFEENGRYRSTIIEDHFAKWGFKFQVITEHQIDPKFVQAANDLHPYIAGHPQVPITDSERESFLVWVEENPGRRLGEMSVAPAPRRTEIAQFFIAQGKVFTSLSELDFKEPDGIRLYPTPQDEFAFHLYLDESRPRPTDLDDLGYRLSVGSLVEISWNEYKVTDLSKTQIQLQPLNGGDSQLLTHRELLDLKPRIGGFLHADKTFETLFHESPIEYRREYSRRKQAIKPYLKGGAQNGHCPEDRTVRLYRDKFIAAERGRRSGDEAIFPKFPQSGQKPHKLSEAVSTALKELIDKHVLDPKDCSATWVWMQLCTKFKEDEIGIGKRTVLRRIAKIDKYRRRRAAVGKAGAAEYEPVYGESETTGSPHGRRAFQRAHIDSTPLDIEHPEDSQQFVAHMKDAYSSKLLGRVITAEHPSELTIRALILDCVRRYGACPAEVSCDWGSEHRSVWLQKSLSTFGVILDYRPKRQPRPGGPVESSFGAMVRTLYHNLPANKQHSGEGRKLARALGARNFAVLSASDVKEMHEAYCTLHDDIPSGNNPSPNTLEAVSFQKFGPPPRQCPTVEELQLLLLPFVEGIRRKVSKRGTIRCNGKNYGIKGVQSPLGKYREKFVDVRWVPEDERFVYVFVPKTRKAIRCWDMTISRLTPDIVDAAIAMDAAKAEEVF